MARKFSGLDAVVHFAGRVDYRPACKRAVWDCDVLGAKRVFDAVLEAGVPKSSTYPRSAPSGSGIAGRLADEASTPYGDPSWPIVLLVAAEALAAVEASDAGDYRFLDRVRVAYFDAKLAGWELGQGLRAATADLPVVTIFPARLVRGTSITSISQLVDKVWEGGSGFPSRAPRPSSGGRPGRGGAPRPREGPG